MKGFGGAPVMNESARLSTGKHSMPPAAFGGGNTIAPHRMTKPSSVTQKSYPYLRPFGR